MIEKKSTTIKNPKSTEQNYQINKNLDVAKSGVGEVMNELIVEIDQ